MENDKQFGN